MHLTLDQLNWGEDETGKSPTGGTTSNQCAERESAPPPIVIIIITIIIIIITININFIFITLLGDGGGRGEEEEARRAEERLGETIAKE